MEESVADYVAQHPKMAGVLFTTLLLLSQSTPVAANAVKAFPGP